MKSRVLIPILMFAHLGCNMPDEILVSNAFLPEEEEMVQEALDEWEEAMDTDTGIQLIFGWQPVFEFDEDTFEGHDGKATMHIVEEFDDGYQSVAFAYDTDFSGYTRYLTTWSIVVVRQNDLEVTPELNEQSFRHILLHEFGHYMGHYKHAGKNDINLMADPSSSEDPVDCIDQAALDRLCAMPKWQCGPNAHTTCD